ncbi:energy transducer TonB [Massilia sp. W12]|uniref:energy transducer TonB n=1 Tax=Massilia sp. W12 TaxID=3126507 RepID=UPI0030D4CF9C
MNFADHNPGLLHRAKHAPGLLVALGVHALALLAVLTHQQIAQIKTQKVELVRIIMPEPLPVQQPKPLPVNQHFKAPPLPQLHPPQLPDLTPPVEHNAPAISQPASIAPPSPLAQAAQPVAPPAPPAPKSASLSPPRFDADYLDNPPPNYPPLSKKAREEGTVLLRVLVDASGHADRVELKESSGFERLDRAALNVVQRWRFVPARQGSEQVSAWVLVPIVFNLRQA